ncbi:MAG: phosphoenolpyruvate--protein phosphotransferase [Bacteroidota bacterium]
MSPDNPDPKENVLKGIAAAPGITMGYLYLYLKQILKVEERSISEKEAEDEIRRLQGAIERSEKELQKILSFAKQRLGDTKAYIFEAEIMILNDHLLFGAIAKRIRTERKNADFILHDEISKYQHRMLASGDEYMRERVHDVEDVKNRIIRNLQEEKLFSRLEGKAIIAAETLTPADTILFSRNDVLGYATDLGSVTSHTAILSRSLKIPAVVGLRTITKQVQTGDYVILDGHSGVVIVHPTPKTIRDYELKHQKYLAFDRKLEGLRDLPSETKDGRRIDLSANVEFEEELDFLNVQGAEGIGLYRSESLLIGRSSFPSEDEQLEMYQKVADRIYPNRVIIRTFDIGGDKLLPDTIAEPNPFLGWRGIRIGLDRPDVLLTQLKAILRSSTKKNVCIMFPMISTVTEVRKAKEILVQAKRDLREAKVKFDPGIKIGVMIEVPSAAVMAEEMAREVDFLSIGTNDLIQYLLAVDRGNPIVSGLYKEFHPAVLRTIRSIIDAGHRSKIWVGMCGEMAGDPLATMILVGLGLDEFSVIPTVLPEIKKIIRAIRFDHAKLIATKALSFGTREEVEKFVHSIMRKKFPDIPIS